MLEKYIEPPQRNMLLTIGVNTLDEALKKYGGPEGIKKQFGEDFLFQIAGSINKLREISGHVIKPAVRRQITKEYKSIDQLKEVLDDLLDDIE